MDNTEDEFWKIKPNLSDHDLKIYRLYGICRRETNYGERISKNLIIEECKICDLEEDFVLMAIQKIDEKYIELCVDKMKRESKQK